MVIAPAIDPFSLKNGDLDGDLVRAVLARVGILSSDGGRVEPTFRRADGTTATVKNLAEIIREDGPLPAEMPLVVQVSRWDRLKDMAGVLQGFVLHLLPTLDGQRCIWSWSVRASPA